MPLPQSFLSHTHTPDTGALYLETETETETHARSSTEHEWQQHQQQINVIYCTSVALIVLLHLHLSRTASCRSLESLNRLAGPGKSALREVAAAVGSQFQSRDLWPVQQASLQTGDNSRGGKRPADENQASDPKVNDQLETWGRESRVRPLEHAASWSSLQNRNNLEQEWRPRGGAADYQLEPNRGENKSTREGESATTENRGGLDSSDRNKGGEIGSTGLGALESAARSSARAKGGAGSAAAPRSSSREATAGGSGSSYTASMSSGAPCGACKFLRRKCVRGCIFAPYFGADQGAARFAAVHKIFGASNVAKLLLHIPMPRRCDAVLTISYEAQARLSDPVYGCVATIFALQQQVASLQAELAMVQAQLADRHAAAAHQLQQQHQQQHQQHQQMGGLSAAASQAAYMQQFEQSELNIPPTSALSMSLPSGSSSAAAAAQNYLRIKEEGSRPYHGMQHEFQYGMPSNTLESLPHQGLVESLEKPRSGGTQLSDQPDDGELQALAHSLLRRSK